MQPLTFNPPIPPSSSHFPPVVGGKPENVRPSGNKRARERSGVEVAGLGGLKPPGTGSVFRTVSSGATLRGVPPRWCCFDHISPPTPQRWRIH